MEYSTTDARAQWSRGVSVPFLGSLRRIFERTTHLSSESDKPSFNPHNCSCFRAKAAHLSRHLPPHGTTDMRGAQEQGGSLFQQCASALTAVQRKRRASRHSQAMAFGTHATGLPIGLLLFPCLVLSLVGIQHIGGTVYRVGPAGGVGSSTKSTTASNTSTKLITSHRCARCK